MGKLLTVAVPAYNMELWIRQCLDSLIDDNLEVLVVDDGSSDRTGEIAREYEKKYPDIFRVLYKEDGCWGYAINRTIKEAAGEYYLNVDSDDWLRKEGLDALIQNLQQHKVDLLAAPGYEYSMKTGKEWPIQFPKNCVYEQEMAFEELCSCADFFFTVHSLIFKTSILQQHNIAVDECYYADMELLAYPMPYVRTVYIQKEPLYMYRVDRDGQSVSLTSRAKHAPEMEKVAYSIMEWFRNQSGPCMNYYRKIAATVIYAYLIHPFALDTVGQSEYIPKLREFTKKYIDSNPELRDYSQYGLFARVLLQHNFNKYAMIAWLWRCNMNNRGISSRLWNLIRK